MFTLRKWKKAPCSVRSGLMACANRLPPLVLLGLAIALLAGCVTEAESRMGQRDLGHGSRPYSVGQVTSGAQNPPEGAQTSAEGYELLQDVLSVQPKLAEAVAKNGRPDAVEVRTVVGTTAEDRYVLFFYRNPPRTLLYEDIPKLFLVFGGFRQVMEMNQVPRSTERQAFGDGPMPPPWPVTIPIDKLKAFGVPPAPSTPQPFSPADSISSYRSISEEIQRGITAVRDEPFERASRAFARLKPNSILPGFNWRLIVFHSDTNYAFSVPDGTIFVSSGLVRKLSDDELVAVFAHVLGHVAYGHDRWFWQEANLAEKTGAVVGTAVLVAAVIFFSQGRALPGPPPPPSEHFGVYSQQREVQANYIAANYLAAAGIPPDTLFDALLKLSRIEATTPTESIKHYRVEQSADFAKMHTADRSAADLGKLLDAGMIGSVSR